MKSRILTYSFTITLLILALSSCVTKKKYKEVSKRSSEKDSVLIAERMKFNSITDSLKQELAYKDSVIDSLSVRLNESALRKEKEKNRLAGKYIKKSTLTKEQEYEKKSLFIYNFSKLIEWPIEYNGTEFIIGVVGDELSLKELSSFMAQKKVAGKKVVVQQYKKGARYNVVYITSSALSLFETVKSSVKRSKTVIVTDKAVAGTHISFILDQDKVRYIVDKASIEKLGLKVGQELIRYAG
jgi:hypothetical protein